MNELKPAPSADLYERDFHAWLSDQAQRLRLLKPRGIDWENLAEEIDSLGRSDRIAVVSNLNVVLLHLIKWKYQSAKRKSGWIASINEHRRRIERLIQSSPSLAPVPAQVLAEEYGKAQEDALTETGLRANAVPSVCPFSVEQVLDTRFLP
jgi:hypothetical protein